MMALDSAVVILMAETLAVLSVLAITLFFISRNKRNNEIKEIDRFISQLEEQELFKNKPLDQLLSETCGFDRELINNTLQDITQSERALFQRIVQLFMQREMALLSEIDQRIGDLSEPYCRLLSAMASSGTKPARAASGSSGEPSGLERVNQQLVRQLDTAMQTIDEITAEYTRVFSGNQTSLELENSSKKMLQIFQDAEHQIHAQLRHPES